MVCLSQGLVIILFGERLCSVSGTLIRLGGYEYHYNTVGGGGGGGERGSGKHTHTHAHTHTAVHRVGRVSVKDRTQS